ncbi:MAG TPA: uridine kinase [Dermatophilaceae bacterium]|nr:uridine kinase [Dermatophilaceae bacterium]
MRPPVTSTERYAVLRALADELVALGPGRRVAVAIDGVDGAGKTVLADQLAEVIGGARHVLRVSIDGFHRPRAERYLHGRGPESFYEDSYDYDAFRVAVVEPFRKGRPVTPAVNDVVADRRVDVPAEPVRDATILLVDGIFLQRPELQDVWDAVVYVDVPFEVSVPRGNARFGEDHALDPDAATNRRYVEGQRLYLTRVRPRERATWVIDNTELDRPVLQRTGRALPASGASPA